MSKNASPTATQRVQESLPPPPVPIQEETLIKELCYVPDGQDQWRFGPEASTAMIGELAKEGWRNVNVFATTYSSFRSGPHNIRTRVYGVFTRPLGTES
jgi:hypothetical protein